MGPSYAACLLAAWLTSAEDAAAPTNAAPTADTPAAQEAAAEPTPALSRTRLALRDPFADPGTAIRYRAPFSPDLIDPFDRPPSDPPASAPPDLRDPFETAAPRRCLPNLRGVPVQRPRQLPQATVPCTIDKPLRNPFAPREPVTTS